MKKMSLALAFLFVSAFAYGQPNHFRSGIFLHHSTGGCIWGPNGSSTSVPDEIAKYNDLHGLTGADSVTMDERGWPETPWDNEWYRWHNIFNNDDTDAVIAPILAANKIVVIKSCFPSSDMWDDGSPGDTASTTDKTTFNYKWHWRSFIRVMSQHPGNFFVVWTNAPLTAGATDSAYARRSDRFCRWAKDTLEAGHDALFGAFPRNVYVFDFFHKLAGADGILPDSLASDHSNSHPNDVATARVAPLFVTEIFNAALAYEQWLTGVAGPSASPAAFRLLESYPNPFNPATTISYELGTTARVTLKVFDVLGREVETLENGERAAGVHHVAWNAGARASGVYLCRLEVARKGEASLQQTKRMMLVR